MAKTKWLQNTVEIGGNVSTLWGLLPAAWQTLVTVGLTTMTAWFSSHEVGIGQAIFYSSGVLAFGMSTVLISLRISQILGMFQRLTIANFGLVSVVLNDQDREIDHLTLNCTLRNDGQRPMFYKLKRVHATMERQAPAGHDVDSTVIVIPAFGGTQNVNFSTIEDIPIPKDRAPAGQLEIEIDYGPDADSLEYHLRQVVTLGISIFSTTPVPKKSRGNKSTLPPGPKQAQLFTQVKTLEHSRVGK